MAVPPLLTLPHFPHFVFSTKNYQLPNAWRFFFCLGLVWEDADGSDIVGPVHSVVLRLFDDVVFGVDSIGGSCAFSTKKQRWPSDGSGEAGRREEVEEGGAHADSKRHHLCRQSCVASRPHQHQHYTAEAQAQAEQGTSRSNHIKSNFFVLD